MRWALRGLGVVFVLGILFLGSNLLFRSPAPPALFAETDLGPLPAPADNGHHDLLVGARGLGSVPRVADPALKLRIGDPIHVRLNTDKVQFFDPKTGASLLW